MPSSGRAANADLTRIFPDCKPVKHLLVCQPGWPVDQVDAWIWLRCLQGLVNRDQPQLYLMTGNPRAGDAKAAWHDDHWLDW